jgi:hypothetical protein
MSGTPIVDALAGLRDDPEQAISRPEPYVSVGVVETFYPVEGAPDEAGGPQNLGAVPRGGTRQPTTVTGTLAAGETVEYDFSGELLDFDADGETTLTVDGEVVDTSQFADSETTDSSETTDGTDSSETTDGTDGTDDSSTDGATSDPETDSDGSDDTEGGDTEGGDTDGEETGGDGTDGEETDGDEEEAQSQDAEEPPRSERDTDGPKVDVRDSITGGLHSKCPILVDSYGDVTALPEGTPVVIERIGPLGMCVTAVRYTVESSSPSIEPEERRLRIGEMVLELSRDSQDRAVGRMGHQPVDGADHNAAFIAREDGSIEGYSAAGVGFCFKRDGSFHVSGMMRDGGGGTPGTGAPGGGSGDGSGGSGGGLPSGTGTIGGGAGYSDTYGPDDGDTVVTRDTSYAGAMGSASGTVFVEDDVEADSEGLSGNGITIAGDRGATSDSGGGSGQ